MDKKIKSHAKELEQLQKKMRDMESERGKLRREEDSLLRTLRRLDSVINRSTKRQVALNRQIREMEKQIERAKKLASAFYMEQGMWEKMWAHDLRIYHARFVYPRKLRREPFKEMVLKEQARWKFSNMKNADSQILFYQEKGKSYFQSVQKLASAKAELEDEIHKQKKAQQEKNKLYQTTQGKRLIAEQQTVELRETVESLEKLISTLMRRKEKTLAEIRESEIAKRSIEGKRGSIPWPVSGKIGSSFGKQVHPELKVPVVNNGIKIRTVPNSRVTSVENGIVIYASDFRSYGQTVIIDHGGDHFAVYGLLGSIAVKEGENVNAGKILGATADDPDSQLYFEWRVGGRAEDPLLWLR